MTNRHKELEGEILVIIRQLSEKNLIRLLVFAKGLLKNSKNTSK